MKEDRLATETHSRSTYENAQIGTDAMTSSLPNDDTFRRLLFHTAALAMACDGEVHPDEIRELKLVARHTKYFSGLNLEAEIATFFRVLEDNKHAALELYFKELASAALDPVRELQVLEVALRMIYADHKVVENEEKFCRLIRKSLRVPKPILERRFGPVPFLDIGALGGKDLDTKEVAGLADGFLVPMPGEFYELDP